MTYRIAPHKAPHSAVGAKDYLRKDNILARQITRCPHHVGDEVWVRTKRGKEWGTVVELICDPSQCEWHNGTQPFFIGIRVPKPVSFGGQSIYRAEIVYAPLKKVTK